MRDRLLKRALRERFLVTLKSGETFDGLLDEWDGSHLKFVDAHVVAEGAGAHQSVKVQGELYLDRGNVAYCQRLPA